jgi:ParB family chromosome partitioning protein
MPAQAGQIREREKTMGKQAVEAKRGTIFMIEPEEFTLITDKQHPLYDPRVEKPLRESLVVNIMKRGVRLNVRATKIGDQVIVVDGRQRVRAACEANKRLKAEGMKPLLVPTLITHGEEKELFNESVFLNEQREDDDPFEKADKARRMLTMGYDEKDIAESFGVNPLTVKNWLRLFELDGEIRNAVRSGKVNVSSAIQLADLPVAEQKSALETLIATGPTVANAAKIARGKTVSEKPSRPGLAVLKATLEHSENIPDDCKAILDWIVGNIQTSTAKKKLDWLKTE